MKIGVLVNPVAGLGGPGAYKGSDKHWKDALARGDVPSAPARAARFTGALEDIEIVTLPGAMGVAQGTVLDGVAKSVGDTTPTDTRDGARALRDAGVDVLCFVGGDGTATDVAHAVEDTVACLGVPAGVKITSPVFAHDPEEAALIVNHLPARFDTQLRDVTDLDEDAYRAGRVDVRLRGALRVPRSPFVQGGKVATASETDVEPLVESVLQQWDDEALTIVGAGSVCRALKSHFHGTPTLLGLDAIRGGRIVAADVDDRRLAALMDQVEGEGGVVRLVLSLIGGQGMLLGRGTQVLRPELLRRIGWDHLTVMAPPEKLLGLEGIHVDSGDPGFDAEAPQWLRVVSGWNETRMVRVLRP